MAEEQRNINEAEQEAPAGTEAVPESAEQTPEPEEEGLLERARDAVEDAVEAATDAVKNVAERASDAVEPLTSFIEDAFERVSDNIDIPSASEAGVTANAPDELLTSLDSAADITPPGESLGFTGEIEGRVVTLAELNEADQDESTRGSYDQLRSLVEQTLTDVSENEIVRGRVVSVGEKDIVIDIGFKSDGIISRNEFQHDLVAGEEVEVFLERIEDYQGQLVLSKSRADTVRRWQRIEDAFNNEQVLEGTIVRRIKGGMIVELFDGVEAFLPGSQIDVRPVRDFDAYLEKRMEFKIVKLNPANENIVVSHKALIEKDLEAQRKKILGTMEPGQVLEGIVKNITDFGVFIDLGGVDGLLHITDLSWGRVSHPSELVGLDEHLNVVVLDYDKDRQRISLGLKQLQPHPWDTIGQKFNEGDVVQGKVVSITDYGAFVELEKGIEGLVHISEMSWTEHIRHPSQMVSLGQLVDVKVLNIDNDGKKISLGMKQLQPDPWEGIAARYPSGTPLRGKVRNITNFGVFVEIEPGIDGLVHISDLSWTKRLKHPSELVKKGQELDVQVLNIDEKERRISLGHKQVETNPWNQFGKIYAEGSDTEGTVSSVEEKGVLIELPLDVEAFIPAGELRNSQGFQNLYHAGETIQMRVIRFDANNKEIIGSEIAKQRAEERASRETEEREKRSVRDQERREVRGYQEQQAATGPTTLGELSGLAALRQQMQDAERSAAADTAITSPQANADLSAEAGMDNRGAIAKQPTGDSDPTAPPADQSQVRETAGNFPPSESSQAAVKGVGETDLEGAAAGAAEVTDDETPVEDVGSKPMTTLEPGRSVGEVESFTHPTGADEERMVTTEDVVDEDESSETTAELGGASATIVADSDEEAEEIARRSEEEGDTNA